MKNKIFEAYLNSEKLPIPTEEYQFYPGRKWRADFAWIDQRVILEVEGGVFTQGRHTRGKGFLNDMQKYNHAAILGFRIIRVTPDQLLTKYCIDLIRNVFR